MQGEGSNTYDNKLGQPPSTKGAWPKHTTLKILDQDYPRGIVVAVASTAAAVPPFVSPTFHAPFGLPTAATTAILPPPPGDSPAIPAGKITAYRGIGGVCRLARRRSRGQRESAAVAISASSRREITVVVGVTCAASR